MSTQIANFASCLGKYDGSTLFGAGTTFDPSSIVIGNSDLSLNSGYLSNPNAFTTPGAGNVNGFSVTGWFNPAGAQASNYTPIFDMSIFNRFYYRGFSVFLQKKFVQGIIGDIGLENQFVQFTFG